VDTAGTGEPLSCRGPRKTELGMRNMPNVIVFDRVRLEPLSE
jgi:hypothetical protein